MTSDQFTAWDSQILWQTVLQQVKPIAYYGKRTHQVKLCCGRTPMGTLRDGKRVWKEKFLG